MAFQTPIPIITALQSIERNEYVLPAIQREFVWRTDQIECLFDSLMRGYPIGSFLFWKVRRDSIEQYKFYDFMLDYHQRNNPHCKSLGKITRDEITAVLDGQQRLTALNIGLRGSYAYKLPRLRFSNPDAYPVRYLYLNLLGEAEENEQDMKYNFCFLTPREAAGRDEKHCWYRVGDVLKARDAVDLHNFLVDRELANQHGPFKILDRLHKVVHTDLIISCYEEKDQDLDKVLDIFIRTNSGGTALSYSDMLMSMATAQWKGDAREAIHGKVNEINQIGDGFWFSKDFLLKAGLMLGGINSVKFRVTNFTRDNMQRLERDWDRITSAVGAAVRLVASFGFSGSTLSAHAAVLPIAHYLYRRAAPAESSVQPDDRGEIRRWLTRSLLKRGIWGGADTLLTVLRKVIDEHGREAFPAERIEEAMRRMGRNLTFEEEELEDLVEWKGPSFALLSMLYPFVDTQNNKFHVDHVFPKSRFKPGCLLQAGVPENDIEAYQDRVNRLPNLQLLAGPQNLEKSAMLPADWLSKTFKDQAARKEYTRNHDLGDVPSEITGFNAFYEARRTRLLDRLRKLLGPDRQERETR